MVDFKYFGAPARLFTLFVLMAGPPLAALGLLGWRLLQEDLALERQRVREQLANDAGVLADESARALSRWGDLLAGDTPSAALLPAGGVLLVVDQKGVARHEGLALPYYPEVDLGTEGRAEVFAEAEQQEFRGEALPDAIAAYRRLSATGNAQQRAGALMRLARCLRKQHELPQALEVYGELAAMGGATVAGGPAELLARNERIALYKQLRDQAAAARESALLASTLQEGRFLLDRATFDFYCKAVPAAPHLKGNAEELARAVEALWPRWRQASSGAAVAGSRGHAFAMVWRPSASGTAVLVGNLDTLLAPVWKLASGLGVRVALEDEGGHLLAGGAAKDRAAKSYRETGLPWTLRVAEADPGAAQLAWQARRNLFAAGFGFMGLVIAAAAYFVFRAVRRELGVAKLQSDFVSAVSHEFRTPLAAMCHMTEMLEENAAPLERVPQYYRALRRETRRLHAMVESLLDFGRIESGRRTYCLEETDAAALARQVMEEFRERGQGAGRLALQAPPVAFPVRADPEAMALALRNLVDNALKYSPESSPVEISVALRGHLAGITVADRGPGIAREEQRAVFRKFVRGEAARALNVKGTGIGLALADRIVRAHGGWVELASDEGHGSRFTILLPAHPGRK